MARTLAKILERKGYDVVDGDERPGGLRGARRRARSTWSITDLNMPVMDGMAAAAPAPRRRSARGERRLLTPPTIVLTGHGTIAGRRRGDEARRRRLPRQALQPRRADHDDRAGAARLRSRARKSASAGGDRAHAGVRRDHRAEPAMRAVYRAIEALAQNKSDGAHHGRERHRQGARRPRHPHAKRPRRASVRRDQLRRGVRHAARQPALRPPPRRLHRCHRPITRACSRRRTAVRSFSTRSRTSRRGCR